MRHQRPSARLYLSWSTMRPSSLTWPIVTSDDLRSCLFRRRQITGHVRYEPPDRLWLAALRGCSRNAIKILLHQPSRFRYPVIHPFQ
ncbi:hypothetical protein [Kibdelosporangium philippinense]|uniref:hypothetical protein n=1 Tax=Kibdelosporangium philippinense TaxID=211113 RepID=UPI003619823E